MKDFLRKGLRIYLLMRWMIAAGALAVFLAAPFVGVGSRPISLAILVALAVSNAFLHRILRCADAYSPWLLASFLIDAVLVEVVTHGTGAEAFGVKYFCVIVVLFSGSLLPWRRSFFPVALILLLHGVFEFAEYRDWLAQTDYGATAGGERMRILAYMIVPHTMIDLAVWATVAYLSRLLFAAVSDVESRARQLDSEVEKRTHDLQVARQAVMHSEKMSVLGQIVSSVAHELNNPLTSVLGFAQLLEEEAAGDPSMKETLGKLRREAERSRKIARNLLVYSRHNEPERHAVQMNDIVREVVDLRAYQNKAKNLAMDTQLASDLPLTLGDVDQLRQVLVNIVLNAEQALEDAPPMGAKTIRIETAMKAYTDVLPAETNSATMAEKSTKRAYTDVLPAETNSATMAEKSMKRGGEEGGRIVVRIWNNGPPIRPHLTGRLFDPFFTTKEPGKGTGLGLFVVHNIVAAHGGSIRVTSDARDGTAFEVILPRAPVSLASQEPAGASPSQGATRMDSRSILLVDDEDLIVDMISQVLSRDGHRVRTARDGVEALERIEEERPDVLLLDFRMPRMGGDEVVQEIERRWPDLLPRVVIVSGSGGGGELGAFLARHSLRNLQKPFDLNRLRELLQGA